MTLSDVQFAAVKAETLAPGGRAKDVTKPSAKTGNLLTEQVVEIRHYTDSLFSFKTTRHQSFRFTSGQFVMMGLQVEGRPLLRAYSIASGYYEDHLEFFSIKVPDGPLTSRLQHIQPGDSISLNARATGTLVLNSLSPGRRLLLLATGTGFAPFASVLRDPETYERFDEVVMAYGCRQAADLAYATNTVLEVREHELLGEAVAGKLHFYTALTREPHLHQGRLTKLLADGQIFRDLGQTGLDPAQDRVMICGNPGMTRDLRQYLLTSGFAEGANNRPAGFVIEKAFVGE